MDGCEHSIDIIKERGHYTVEVDGRFYCSCDTLSEVDEEIPAILNIYEYSLVRR
jgi:hypothetical protein